MKGWAIFCILLATTATCSNGFSYPRLTKLQASWTEQLSPISLGGDNTPSPSNSRRPIVAGNWKLNPSTRNEALELLKGLKIGGDHEAEVVVFPPLPYLSDALSILEGTGIKVGAQNAGHREKGAFTGEIAPSMLASAGCSYVLLGHSERRTLFGETDTSVNERLRACLAQPALSVVLCVGETLEEYEAGLLASVVDTQLRKGLAGVGAAALRAGRVVVAYEPVWAIGTGLVATPAQAQAAHEAIRRTLAAMHADAPDVARAVRVQYGGSVGPDSVADLMAMPDVDGALVGGASLVADSFAKIVRGAAGPGAGAGAAAPPASAAGNAAAGAGGGAPVAFSHAPLAHFAVDRLTPKGPRKNADVGRPHDATRPLAKAGPLSAGAWWCARGGWPSPAPRATTEVFKVLSGHACVTDMGGGARHFMGPGDLVVLPKGWAGRWDVLEDIHKVWAVVDHPDVGGGGGGAGAIVVHHSEYAPAAQRGEGGGGGAPALTALDNGHVAVGTWAPGAGAWAADRHEWLHVVGGVFFLTDAADGSARRCAPGDTVVLPRGWAGVVDVVEPATALRVSAA